MAELQADERSLLMWLGESDLSQYGECYGQALDRLAAAGLAEVLGPETEMSNPFIAKGHGIMYRAVRLTDSGYARRDLELEKEAAR
jgi:hypothetical protein